MADVHVSDDVTTTDHPDTGDRAGTPLEDIAEEEPGSPPATSGVNGQPDDDAMTTTNTVNKTVVNGDTIDNATSSLSTEDNNKNVPDDSAHAHQSDNTNSNNCNTQL